MPLRYAPTMLFISPSRTSRPPVMVKELISTKVSSVRPVMLNSPPVMETSFAASSLSDARISEPLCMKMSSPGLTPCSSSPALRSVQPVSMVSEPPFRMRLVVLILSVVLSVRGSKSSSTVRDVPLSMVTLGSVHGAVAGTACVAPAVPMTSMPATARLPRVFRKWQLRRIVRQRLMILPMAFPLFIHYLPWAFVQDERPLPLQGESPMVRRRSAQEKQRVRSAHEK